MAEGSSVNNGDIAAVDRLIRRGFTQKHPTEQINSEWAVPIERFSTSDRHSDLFTFYENHCKVNDEEWCRNSEIATALLQLVLKSLRNEAERKYPCVQFEDYIPQGSAKEGLKVGHANEFDALFPIKLLGINPTFVTYKDDRVNIPPGFTEIRTEKPKDDGMFNEYTKLEILKRVSGDTKEMFSLSSWGIHCKLFQGLMDRALKNIKERLDRGKAVCFDIKPTIRAPTIALSIAIESQEQSKDRAHPPTKVKVLIDIDIVLGIAMDTVSSPEAPYCRRYAVCRWIQESKAATMKNKINSEHLDTLWRISHSGFELYIIEKCRKVRCAEYICTACRILKSIKDVALQFPGTPPQFCTVVKTYYLKIILLYAILNLHIRNKVKLSGVCEAFAYITEMFRVVLTDRARCLPNFFLGNFYSQYIFIDEHSPSSAFYKDYARMNLFGEVSEESMRQVALSFDEVLQKLNFKTIVDMQKVDLDKKYLVMFAEHIAENPGR